tara:strand:+ start:20157 stop:21068 length:912 start_codon:yes stop_codon:yes gene_type:complete
MGQTKKTTFRKTNGRKNRSMRKMKGGFSFKGNSCKDTYEDTTYFAACEMIKEGRKGHEPGEQLDTKLASKHGAAASYQILQNFANENQAMQDVITKAKGADLNDGNVVQKYTRDLVNEFNKVQEAELDNKAKEANEAQAEKAKQEAAKKKEIIDTIFNYYNSAGKITTAPKLEDYCKQIGRQFGKVTTQKKNTKVTRPVCMGRPEYESCLLPDWMAFSHEVAEKDEYEKEMISKIETLDPNYKTNLKYDLPKATAYYHRKSDSDQKMHLDSVYLPPLSGGRKTKSRRRGRGRKQNRKTKNVKK